MTSPSLPPGPPATPPLPGASKKPKWLLPVLAAVGVLVVGLVIIGVIVAAGAAGFWYFHNQKSQVVKESPSPQKLQEDYLMWNTVRQKVGDYAGTGLEPMPVKSAGWWESWFVLPPDSVSRNALLEKLPRGYRLKEFKLAYHEKTEEGYQLAYNVIIEVEQDQFLVPVQRYNPAAKSKTFLRYSPYLVFAPDLPAGLSYATASMQKKTLAAGDVLRISWQVPLVAKKDGAWQAVETDPLPFERNPLFESRAVSESGKKGTSLLRSGVELDQASQQTVMAVSDLDARIASIEADSASYRQGLMADLPSRGVDRGGASGTGTPTKAGIGVVAGAGTGALIGGVAGGGDGAAIGAGAGAVAGLFGGYVVGRSDEKRAAERQNSVRNSALRQVESQAANYKAGLYKQLEEELKNKAAEHDAALQNGLVEAPFSNKKNG